MDNAEVITRSDAEKRLLDNECETVQQMAFKEDLSYVHDIFYSGFKGYAHFTNEQLAQEIKEQGLFDDGAYEGVTVVADPIEGLLSKEDLSFVTSVMHIVSENMGIFDGIHPDHREKLNRIVKGLPKHVELTSGAWERLQQYRYPQK